ncbi:MAG: 50S ribosome-binding GTPase [Clostridiales bacterium]|nr:MAG: 50S ribosome-binding GTPase [Clostridiales bacterium]
MSLSANLDVISDFPEEGLEPLSDEEYYNLLVRLRDKTKKLYDTADKGRIIRNGIKTVIVGKPNVGKSSLLNLLSGSERAIVTDVEGTTRDIIEEQIDLGSVMLAVSDTAGIRTTDDKVEKIGVEMSKKRASEAELVIFMLDAMREIDENDTEIFELINGKNGFFLVNKKREWHKRQR